MSFYIVEKDGLGISVRGIAKSRSVASKVASSSTRIVDENGLRELKRFFIVTSGERVAKVMMGSSEVKKITGLAKDLGVPLTRRVDTPKISLRDWVIKDKGLTSLEYGELKDASLKMLDSVLGQMFPSGGFHTNRTQGKVDSLRKKAERLGSQYGKLVKEYEGLLKKGRIRMLSDNVPLSLNKEQDRAYLRNRIRRALRKKGLDRKEIEETVMASEILKIAKDLIS